ncbi:MAG: GntR family transcriptional regulator, partial [Actinomycetota bacterium]
PNMTAALIEELELILGQMVTVEDEREWLELNHRFHQRQYEASGRTRLCGILANIRDASSAYMHMVIFEARKSGRSAIEHQEILEAIKARDVGSAQRAIVHHLHQTVEHVLESLKESEEATAVPEVAS